ncbi:MAG: MBG domain-containing protein, partial [Candidatus Fimimonas sp.]
VADSKTKTAGESDPELTYTVTGLIGSDKLSGALAREEGEEKGEYTITIGTLSAQNYEIQFTSAKLTVEKASGCRSAIGGIAGVVAVVAIVGLGFVFRKKKEN